MNPEHQTALIFILLAASAYRGLRAEYVRTCDGYSEISYPLEHYIEDNFDGFWRRQRVRFERVQALLAGG